MEKSPQLPQELAENYQSISTHESGRMYGVDEMGKKTRLKADDVLNAYGYGEDSQPNDWEQQTDSEKLASHADWNQKLNTTRTTKEDLETSVGSGEGVKASENGLTEDDFLYQATLKEMAEEGENKGKSLREKMKDDKESDRKAELKKLANLRMRVKTGNLDGLSPDDVEYVMNQIDEDKKRILDGSESGNDQVQTETNADNKENVDVEKPKVVNEEKTKDGWKSEITVEQAKHLNDAWEKQTGAEAEGSAEVEETPSDEDDSEIIPTWGNDTVGEEENATPADQDTQRDRNAEGETSKGKEKKSWRKRLAIGAVALAGLLGAGLVANSLADDSENANETPTATTEVTEDNETENTSPIDMSDDEGVFDEPVEAEVDDTEVETPDEADPDNSEAADAETSDAEKISVAAQEADEATLAPFVGIDSSQIETGGDVMPLQNVDSWAPVEANLDQYNKAFGRDFVIDYNDNGQFKEGTHIINPAELAQYNQLMKSLAEQANLDSEE